MAAAEVGWRTDLYALLECAGATSPEIQDLQMLYSPQHLYTYRSHLYKYLVEDSPIPRFKFCNY